MQKVLARYVLNDLLENHFAGNKTQMARQLELTVRTLQRILNNEESERNGNAALSRALDYYVKNRIPLDKAFRAFVSDNDTSEENDESLPEACRERLQLPEDISEAGKAQFQQLILFLCEISEFICPNCADGCQTDRADVSSTYICKLLEIGIIVRRSIVEAFSLGST